MTIGEMIEARGRLVRIAAIEYAVVRRRHGVIEHRLMLTTLPHRVRVERENVVPMPVGPPSFVADFLRYHVLVRVYDGDIDAWLAHLRDGGGDEGDVRFVRALRMRLRRDPALLDSIRRMVHTTSFWSAAGGVR